MDETQRPVNAPGAKTRRVQVFALAAAVSILGLGVLLVSGGARQIVILIRDAANALGIIG